MTEFVACTPREGAWEFTRSTSPVEAVRKLQDAIYARSVLCFPIDNPISAVAAHHATPQAGEEP